jgi:hypothetical protein
VSTLYAPHAPNRKRLAAVVDEMVRLGPPTIRAVRDGDVYFAIEGSHRIAAADRLGMTPIIEEVAMTDRVRHDFDDIGDRNTVAEIVSYLSGEHPNGPSGISWVPYEFEDL